MSRRGHAQKVALYSTISVTGKLGAVWELVSPSSESREAFVRDRNAHAFRYKNPRQAVFPKTPTASGLKLSIIGRAEFPVGSGRADFHVRATDLVEAKGRPPAIAQGTGAIDRGVILGNQSQLQGIVPRQHRGNFLVFAHRIACARGIGPPCHQDFLENFQICLDRPIGGIEPVRQSAARFFRNRLLPVRDNHCGRLLRRYRR